MIALFLILALVPTTVIVAQNATNTSVDGMVTAINITDNTTNVHLLNETVHEEPLEHLNLTEDNVTEQLLNETVIENSTGNVTIPEDNTTIPDANETIVNETNVTGNENVTIIDYNATTNETNVTIPEENVTIVNGTNVTSGEEPANVTENVTVTEEAELSVDIVASGKITRGQLSIFRASVDNVAGGDAYNVKVEWILPEYLTVIDGNALDDVGLISAGGTYTSEIVVLSAEDAGLGPDEIRVRVSYE